MINANIQYLDIQEPDIYRDRQLYLLILLPLCMIGITPLVYIIKKFRHDIFDQICHWIIVFICRYCLYMDLHNDVSVDSLSVTSSSCGTSNTTSLKRRLSYNVENEVHNQSSSTNKSFFFFFFLLFSFYIYRQKNM